MTRALGRKSIKERITEKVEIQEGTGCWMWTGAVTRQAGRTDRGIIKLTVAPGVVKRRYAHVLAFEEWVGPVPEGLELDHYRFPGRCIGPLCVRPSHLKPVTHAVNSLRSSSPWAIARRKTHCKWGHKFTKENTIVRANGTRECRACKQARRNPNGS